MKFVIIFIFLSIIFSVDSIGVNNDKCGFEVDDQVTCGKSMRLYDNPIEGCEGRSFCDCDQGYRSSFPCSDHPVRFRVYIPRFQQCFPVFSQGPCRPHFWLTWDENKGSVRCSRNPCYPRGASNSSSVQYWFYDPVREECFQTLTQGYCPPGQMLELVHDSSFPKCSRKLCHSTLTVRSALHCRPGSRYNYVLGTCHTTKFQSKGKSMSFGFRRFRVG